jgi:aldehyde dehydrogenase (NAD+)
VNQGISTTIKDQGPTMKKELYFRVLHDCPMEQEKLSALFNGLKQAQYQVGAYSYTNRIKQLKQLKTALAQTYRSRIHQALQDDFGKPSTEVDLTELYPVIGEIDQACHHLKKWMSPTRVHTPISIWGSTSYYIQEPKGVCLIMSPWNYPVNLVFSPLVSALAAGNTVMVKPSEHSPKTSALVAEIIESIWPENHVAVVQGGIEVASNLLEFPWNHIHFTGAPSIGKIVMAAASKHLSSVTLELGGQSPLIIDQTADVADCAQKLAWSKWINAGQTCIAPNHVWVHRSKYTELIDALKGQINAHYQNTTQRGDSYCQIVNQKHFDRLSQALNETVSGGGEIVLGGTTIAEDRYIAPTVVVDSPQDSRLMNEEIFGPILPVLLFDDVQEVIEDLKTKEKPLALYFFSKNKNNIDQVLKYTRAGSTCINHAVVQYANGHLPFGGSNNSGLGKSHGVFGFQEFSNQRSVVKTWNNGLLRLVFPPYTPLKQKLAQWSIKWL